MTRRRRKARASGEQLELFAGYGPGNLCSCGRPLVEHIEAFRQLCCMCILQRSRDNAKAFADEDPDEKRRHYFRWLSERR